MEKKVSLRRKLEEPGKYLVCVSVPTQETIMEEVLSVRTNGDADFGRNREGKA